MKDVDRFVSVEFFRFKALERFTLNLNHMNILVGPNNAGKSTILTSFRILSHAMRKAENKKAESVEGPEGQVLGYKIDLAAISVAAENIFFNYDDEKPAWINFKLSNGNSLLLFFPEKEVCYLIADAQGRACSAPSKFKQQFNCSIGFVPILGPVEHNEELYEETAARRALFNYRAARNFRNIWHHYPEGFSEFQELISQTWPGMEILPPEIDYTHERVRLHMWCPEERKPREIFWSGFGFQVWCQMLTYILKSRTVSLFLIDEPDIYLHSDLQRQLLSILRELGPDILLATHSTEIVTEAETDDVVLIDKRRVRSKRLKNTNQLGEVFGVLGSAVNPVLTQLAKTKRVVFVEGADFQMIGRFAKRLSYDRISSRSDFAVIRLDGFNPERIKHLKAGMDEALGTPISAAAILDRDYRCDEEREGIIKDCEAFCRIAIIHESKEIENFLLVPDAIDRAVGSRLSDRARRGGDIVKERISALSMIDEFAELKRPYILSQFVNAKKNYLKKLGASFHETTLIEQEMRDFEKRWRQFDQRVKMLPGKDALSFINTSLQDAYNISITPTAIIDSMHVAEVPLEVSNLVSQLYKFSN